MTEDKTDRTNFLNTVSEAFGSLRTADFKTLGTRVLRLEFGLLLTIAVLTGAAWLFLAIADEVIEGETHALDERLLLALRNNPADLGDPIGPPWFEEMMRDFTALGGLGVLALLTVSVFFFLVLQRKNHGAFLLLAVTTGGMLLSLLLKAGFDRPRPDLVPHGSYASYASFPSGHSMLAAATYLTLGALLARLQPGLRLKLHILALAVTFTVLVGVSRVYLGVHWPSDVAAGWAAGAVWAAACWLAARTLQRRGQVETDDEEADEVPPRTTGLRGDEDTAVARQHQRKDAVGRES